MEWGGGGELRPGSPGEGRRGTGSAPPPVALVWGQREGVGVHRVPAGQAAWCVRRSPGSEGLAGAPAWAESPVGESHPLVNGEGWGQVHECTFATKARSDSSFAPQPHLHVSSPRGAGGPCGQAPLLRAHSPVLCQPLPCLWPLLSCPAGPGAGAAGRGGSGPCGLCPAAQGSVSAGKGQGQKRLFMGIKVPGTPDAASLQ